MSSIAICLLNWNGLKETIACVESILNDLGENENIGIFILDNGSKGNDYEKLVSIFGKTKSIFLLRSIENVGFTGGVNLIVKEVLHKTNFEYLFLLNNDVEVKNLSAFFSRVSNRIGIFGPQVRYFDNKDMVQSVGGTVNLWTGICKRIGDKHAATSIVEIDKELYRDYIFGCAILISREVIEKVGLLNEEYFAYYEEVDYCMRAKEKGYMVCYVPEGIIFHKDSVSARKISGFHIYMMFRNRIIFLKKFASISSYIFSFFYLAIYFPYFLLKYGWLEARFLSRGTIDGIKGRTGNPYKYTSSFSNVKSSKI
jgi:GT2 family glycosyltransferase